MASTKSIIRLFEKILSSPYKFKNNSTELSYNEELLIDFTCNDLDGKDGQISKEELTAIWKKIKLRIKKDIQKGNHKNKLIGMDFLWNKREKYFCELILKETGVFSDLLKHYRHRFEEMPTEEEAEVMSSTCLGKFTEY